MRARRLAHLNRRICAITRTSGRRAKVAELALIAGVNPGRAPAAPRAGPSLAFGRTLIVTRSAPSSTLSTGRGTAAKAVNGL